MSTNVSDASTLFLAVEFFSHPPIAKARSRDLNMVASFPASHTLVLATLELAVFGPVLHVFSFFSAHTTTLLVPLAQSHLNLCMEKRRILNRCIYFFPQLLDGQSSSAVICPPSASAPASDTSSVFFVSFHGELVFLGHGLLFLLSAVRFFTCFTSNCHTSSTHYATNSLTLVHKSASLCLWPMNHSTPRQMPSMMPILSVWMVDSKIKPDKAMA